MDNQNLNEVIPDKELKTINESGAGSHGCKHDGAQGFSNGPNGRVRTCLKCGEEF